MYCTYSEEKAGRMLPLEGGIGEAEIAKNRYRLDTLFESNPLLTANINSEPFFEKEIIIPVAKRAESLI